MRSLLRINVLSLIETPTSKDRISEGLGHQNRLSAPCVASVRSAPDLSHSAICDYRRGVHRPYMADLGDSAAAVYWRGEFRGNVMGFVCGTRGGHET